MSGGLQWDSGGIGAGGGLDNSSMTERLHTVFEPLQVEDGRQAYPSAVNHLLPSGTQAVAARICGNPWSGTRADTV